MRKRLVWLLLPMFCLLLLLIAKSERPVFIKRIAPAESHSSIAFIKNQGQWHPNIEYLVQINGGHILFEKDRLTYIFKEPHGHDHTNGGKQKGLRKQHVLSLRFQDSGPDVKISPEQKSPTYHNYFLGSDTSFWRSHVPLFKTITYIGIYPGIDLQVYGLGQSLKYDFIVQPGADFHDIALVYEGADALSLENGRLHIQTSLRDIEEMAPVSFQYVNDRKRKVESEFVLQDNVLGFKLNGNYDPYSTLVIDPELKFSTYTGSPADNWGFTATYDEEGNSYAGGIQYDIFGGLEYPTTTGAIQTAYAGGMEDITLAKFNPDGSQMLYATFLGGTADDRPHSLIVNSQNELFVFGRTNSIDFPVTASAFDTQKSGADFDAFVAKINADGTALLASTYIGGSQDDAVNGSSDIQTYTNLKYNYGDDSRGEIILDEDGNCYIASCTQSLDFPVTNSVFQGNLRGQQDAFIMKLDPELEQILWASYLGGQGEDAAYGIKIGTQREVYVTGGTESTDFPTSANAYRTIFQGGSADGFLAKISSSGNQLLNSTFLGTSAYDQAYFVELDRFGEVYVFGQTEGLIPLVDSRNGPVAYNPGSKQFIQKLNPTFDSLRFSTVFGSDNATSPNISPTAFLVDNCENIYVAGWGGKTNSNPGGPGGDTYGMPISPDAFQATTDGSDFYLMVMSKDAQSLLYGSYFGGFNPAARSGEHVDGGTCRFDKNGVIYHAVCADCGGFNTFPTTPGAFSDQNGSDNCNLAIFKMAFELGGISADFGVLDSNRMALPDARGCRPFSLNFENKSQNTSITTTYRWDFADGSAESTEFEPQHTFTQAGTYQIRLILTDSTSCNISDTSYQTIEVLELPQADAGDDETICLGDSVSLEGSGGNSFQWTPMVSITNAQVPNPIAFPVVSTTYSLLVSDSFGCQGRDEVQITVDAGPILELGDEQQACKNEQINLSITTSNTASLQWSPSRLFVDPSVEDPVISSLDTTVWVFVNAQSNNGCSQEDSLRINVFNIDIVNPDSLSICAGDSIQIFSTGNATSYSWSPMIGLDNSASGSPIFFPNTTTNYTLLATNAQGCESSESIEIRVNALPIANAGQDVSICLNDSIQLQGSGGIVYEWSPNIGISEGNIPSPYVFPQISTTYTLRVRDENGCEQHDDVFVTVNPLPFISASGGGEICFGDGIQLFASGGQNYRWEPSTLLDDPNSIDPLAQPLQSTWFLVQGESEFGCQNDDSVWVEVIPQARAQIDGEDISCPGTSVNLLASGGDSYLWSTGESTSNISVSPLETTEYFLTAYNGICQGTQDSFLLRVAEAFPEAEFLPSDTVGYAPFQVSFDNLSQNTQSYVWNFGDGGALSYEENPIHVFGDTGTYKVFLIAFSDEGCSDTMQLSFEVLPLGLHVPTGFSPNSDGFNDGFFVGHDGIERLTVKIFNRWGQLLFESEDKDFVWDGTYQGRSVQEGVYVYVIQGYGENGFPHNKTGTVTLIR